MQLLLYNPLAQKSSAFGSYLYHKTPKPLHRGLLISTGFLCSSPTDIFTVLQTSFYPSTFIHSFPFYGISFFRLLCLLKFYPSSKISSRKLAQVVLQSVIRFLLHCLVFVLLRSWLIPLSNCKLQSMPHTSLRFLWQLSLT